MGKTRERGHGEVIKGSNTVNYMSVSDPKISNYFANFGTLEIFLKQRSCVFSRFRFYDHKGQTDYCRSEDSSGGVLYARSSTRVGTPPSKAQFVLKKLLGFK